MNLLRVVLDACVIIPMPLCDTLLRAAEQGMYKFYTSPKILEETTRNLSKIFIEKQIWSETVALQKAEKRVNQIKKIFSDALVCPSESLIANLENDAKDRHVLAAAIEAQRLKDNTTVFIVTHNLKDFPSSVLAKFNVQAISPDQFLLKLVQIYNASILLSLLIQQAEDNNYKLLHLLKRLEKGGIKEFVTVMKLTMGENERENYL